MIQYIYKKKVVCLVARLIDFLGYSVLYVQKKRSSFRSSKTPIDAKKILIFKPDHLGDVFLATPVFQCMKEKFPHSRITCIIGTWAKPILKDSPHIDEIIYFNVPWFSRDPLQRDSWMKLAEIILKIRKEKFHAFYCLRSDILGTFLGFLSGIPERSGFINGGGGFLLTHSYVESNQIHQTELLLQTVHKSNERFKNAPPYLNLSPETVIKANSLLAEKCGPSEKIAGFHIGAGYPSKVWAVEKYGLLIKKISLKFGLRPVLIGGEDDMKRSRLIENTLKECHAINLCGVLDLPLSSAIMNQCTLFVGNDSAPVHIAASFGIPTIVIFSAANSPERWSPIGNRVVNITKNIPCKMCEKSTCVDTKCLHLISTEEVLDAAEKILRVNPEKI